jgi:homoserine dehydrogenase
MSKPVKIVLCGLGNVGRALLELLAERSGEIESRYGLRLLLAAAVDTGGAAVGLASRLCCRKASRDDIDLLRDLAQQIHSRSGKKSRAARSDLEFSCGSEP